MSALIIPTKTMSSREIAELTGKEHKNVLADIRKMLEDLGKTSAEFSADLPDAYGRPQTVYSLPKRETLILVSGYSVTMRAKIIDRWQELEAQASQTAIPQSLPEALRLAADLAEAKAQVEQKLAIAAPKAEALDLISAGTDAVTIREAAKLLGVKEDRLTTWMHANGWIYRINGRWVGYQRHIESGHLKFKEARYTNQTTGQECHAPYCHILPKGMAKLAVAFAVKEPVPG